jgi:hypothetical protein
MRGKRWPAGARATTLRRVPSMRDTALYEIRPWQSKVSTLFTPRAGMPRSTRPAIASFTRPMDSASFRAGFGHGGGTTNRHGAGARRRAGRFPIGDAASTSADDQLALRQHMAGIIAEICFLPDVRAGSSRDEVAIGQLLCENIGTKTGRNPHEIMAETNARLLADLRRDESAVHAIANSLMRDKVLRGAKLAARLAPVEQSR